MVGEVNYDGSGERRYTHPSGFVYILRNPAFPGLLKVGETSGSPYQKALELQGTGVPMSFEVVRAYFVKDRRLSERIVHDTLGGFRVSDNREFFKTNETIAVEMAEAALRDKQQLDMAVCPPSGRETELDGEVTELQFEMRELERDLADAWRRISQFKDRDEYVTELIETVPQIIELYRDGKSSVPFSLVNTFARPEYAALSELVRILIKETADAGIYEKLYMLAEALSEKAKYTGTKAGRS